MADYAFRRYHTDLLGAINMPKQVKELTGIVNSRYHEFTERAVKIYQQSIAQLKDFPVLKNQGCLQKVYPALEEGKKVVFVMVDAFRFEMGNSGKQKERWFPIALTQQKSRKPHMRRTARCIRLFCCRYSSPRRVILVLWPKTSIYPASSSNR